VLRTVRRYSLVAGVALFALMVGPVAAAQASNATIVATLNQWGPKIVKDENAVAKGLKGYPQGKAKPLVKALNHEVSDLHRLNHTLRGESASTKAGRKGKNKVTKGLGLIATAYASLSRDVKQANGGPVAASKVNAAVATDKKGRKDLKAGLKLLGA
jgi:hypothetical protein